MLSQDSSVGTLKCYPRNQVLGPSKCYPRTQVLGPLAEVLGPFAKVLGPFAQQFLRISLERFRTHRA